MICCNEYIDLGCLNACEPINLKEVADEDGTYVLLLEFNEVVTKIEVDFSIGDDLIFEADINENYNYTAKLIAPSEAFTCYKFKSKIYL